MNEEPVLHLILEDSNDVAKWRRRTAFLSAVLIEIILILLLIVATPYLRRRAALMAEIAEQEQPQAEQQQQFLVMPPDLERELRKPKTNILSDKNRLARGPSPVVKPNGLRAPYMRGNTHLPKLAGGSPPPPPKEQMTPPSAQAPQPSTQQAAKNNPPPPPKPEEKPKITLSNITPPAKRNPLLAEELGMSTPGQMIERSAQEAARGRAMGQIPGPGNSVNQLNNLNPNFSTSGPIILSDTRGVDFGPYLAQILMIVRQNWYAVIPESARLGARGRTALVFEILKDGSVPQLRLVAPSGTDSLDRAAEAGIRASIPFPPLPKEFTGNHLVLQFNFFYNMTP